MLNLIHFLLLKVVNQVVDYRVCNTKNKLLEVFKSFLLFLSKDIDIPKLLSLINEFFHILFHLIRELILPAN